MQNGPATFGVRSTTTRPVERRRHGQESIIGDGGGLDGAAENRSGCAAHGHPPMAIDPGLLPRMARAMTASLGPSATCWAAAHSRPSGRDGVHDKLRPQCGSARRAAPAAGRGRRAGRCPHQVCGPAWRSVRGWPATSPALGQTVVVEKPAVDPRVSRGDFLQVEGRALGSSGCRSPRRYALEGVLGVFVRSADAPDAETFDALGALAAQVALAVESARLDADGERRRREAEALAAVAQRWLTRSIPRWLSQLIAGHRASRGAGRPSGRGLPTDRRYR